MKEQRIKAGDQVSVSLGLGVTNAFVLATFRIGLTEYSTLRMPADGVEHAVGAKCEDRFTVRSDGLQLLALPYRPGLRW
jgi:hypothetical protein